MLEKVPVVVVVERNVSVVSGSAPAIKFVPVNCMSTFGSVPVSDKSNRVVVPAVASLRTHIEILMAVKRSNPAEIPEKVR